MRSTIHPKQKERKKMYISKRVTEKEWNSSTVNAIENEEHVRKFILLVSKVSL